MRGRNEEILSPHNMLNLINLTWLQMKLLFVLQQAKNFLLTDNITINIK